jgi:hypothetical protein
LSDKASITERGAVLLGKSVACDAFDDSRPLRVVTHAHADHMIGLQQSLRTSEKVLMTKATKDLIDVMKSPLFLMGGYVETLDYGRTLIHYGEESITLFPGRPHFRRMPSACGRRRRQQESFTLEILGLMGTPVSGG